MKTRRKWKAKEPNGKGLAWYFENEFLPARLATRAPQTVYQYRLNLARFDEYLKRGAKLSDLQDAKVLGCLAWVQKECGLSVASASKLRDNLVTLWEFLAKRGRVKRWPEVPPIQEPKKIPVAFTMEQLQTLWEFLKRLPGDVNGTPSNHWFCALVAFLWDTGERIGSVLQVRFSDIDFDRGYVVTRAGSRKGKMADHLSKLHPETLGLLRSIASPPREVVFQLPFCATHFYRLWHELLRRAGLPHGREYCFHAIRKSCASYVKLAGGDPSQVLGHRSPFLAAEVYIDPVICPSQHAVDFLPRLHEDRPGGKGGLQDAG